MSTNPKVLIEEDKPPVGTPCIVCKAAGHWCQADVWCAGDSPDKGICNACINHVDCAVIEKRNRRAPLFEPDPDAAPVAPVRSIPVPQAVLANGRAKEPTQLPAPAPATSDARPDAVRYQAIADRLLRLAPGETVTLAVPDGRKLREFEICLVEFLAAHPPTADVRWVHGPDGSGTRLVMATEKDLRKRVTRAKIEPAASMPAVSARSTSAPAAVSDLCACGRPAIHKGRCGARRADKPVASTASKPVATETMEARSRAKGMLRARYGIPLIQERTGLKRDAILRIKQEMGMPDGIPVEFTPRAEVDAPEEVVIEPPPAQTGNEAETKSCDPAPADAADELTAWQLPVGEPVVQSVEDLLGHALVEGPTEEPMTEFFAPPAPVDAATIEPPPQSMYVYLLGRVESDIATIDDRLRQFSDLHTRRAVLDRLRVDLVAAIDAGVA